MGQRDPNLAPVKPGVAASLAILVEALCSVNSLEKLTLPARGWPIVDRLEEILRQARATHVSLWDLARSMQSSLLARLPINAFLCRLHVALPYQPLFLSLYSTWLAQLPHLATVNPFLGHAAPEVVSGTGWSFQLD